MGNFKVIYNILKTIEKSMDFEEFDKESISHQRLNISYERQRILINQLVKDGFIDGILLVSSFNTETTKDVKIVKPVLTLKGMEYLEENSMMKKASNGVV